MPKIPSGAILIKERKVGGGFQFTILGMGRKPYRRPFAPQNVRPKIRLPKR